MLFLQLCCTNRQAFTSISLAWQVPGAAGTLAVVVMPRYMLHNALVAAAASTASRGTGSDPRAGRLAARVR